jgi:hypothetical protein
MPLRLHDRTRKRPHLGGPGRREGPGCPRPIWSIPITAIRIGEPAGRMSRLYGAADRRRPRMLSRIAFSASRDDGPCSSHSDDRGRHVPCDRGRVHDRRARESPDCRSRRPTSPPQPGAWPKRIVSTLPRLRTRQRRSTNDVSCWGFSRSRVIAAADVNASAAPEFHRSIRARQSTRAFLRRHAS